MEKFLLDTHVVLWAASEPSKLTEKVIMTTRSAGGHD